MPVTCAICTRKYNTLSEMANHMKETYEGTIGETADVPYDNKLLDDPIARQYYVAAMTGNAHRVFLDRNGDLIPELDMTLIAGFLAGGTLRCMVCSHESDNNYLVFKHMEESKHYLNQQDSEIIRRRLKMCEDFQARYF